MKTCLIIGNGPSLADIPNEFLENYPTFGSNRVYLKYTPDYYAYVDPINLSQKHIEEIKALNCTKYIDISQAHLIPGSIPLQCIHEMDFSYSPMDYVYAYFSVTTVLLQLAYFYGFDEIGLVGMDHRWITDAGARDWYINTGKDKNHFTPEYYQPGARWKAPFLSKLEAWYGLSKTVYCSANKRIVNLTPNSALDVFEREDWQSWEK